MTPSPVHLLFLFVLLPHAFTDELEWVRQRYVDASSEEILTEDFAIHLTGDVDPHWFAKRYGFEHLDHVVGDVHHFRLANQTQESHLYARSAYVLWSQQQTARQRSKRGQIPTDPLYPSQWHLHTSDKSPKGIHLNVENAWKLGSTGQGVTVAIVDDGIEYTHPDLRANYNSDGSYDVNFNDANPYPDSSRDDHGTSAAGATAAGANGVCGTGTAYNAKLAAIRILSKTTTDIDEAKALKYRNDINSIYSNSWGPVDDGRRKEGPGPLAFAAIQESIAQGRGGKGSIYLWAGGNGRRSGDNCNYDGWANSKYTVAIAAMTHQGTQAWYSESCAMLIGAAPSSGDSAAITTTDLMGTRGTNGGDCTTSFGGTSAAAPMVAGVVALILEANPRLTWRDVQGVLIRSSRGSYGTTNEDWVTTRANPALQYSHKFGFGLIDAGAAVALAKNWVMLPAYINATAEIRGEIPITAGTRVNLNVQEEMTLEHVDIYFKAECGKRGNLEISLSSPGGTLSYLAEKHGDTNPNYDWRFGSIVHWGEPSAGLWTLIVKDSTLSDGKIGTVKIVLFGHKNK